MIISIIVAIGNKRVIGVNNALPWEMPADMEHFREVTAGKPVIMGQKTFESIGKPLPNRKNIVLTRDGNFKPAGCVIVGSIDDALKAAADFDEVMIIGGVSIYAQFLPLANRLYLTFIHADFNGDAYFPEFDYGDWKEIDRADHDADEKNPYPYSFVTFERK